MAWTQKMVDDLMIMWKQGITTGEIGKRLGVSKNSIVGKVHRLQLDARPSPIRKKDDEDAELPLSESEPEPKVEEKKAPKEKTSASKTPKSKPQKAKAEPTKDLFADEAKPAPEKIKAPLKPVSEDVIKRIERTSVTANNKAPKKDGLTHLMDLDNHTCRWPIGDPKDENFHFCGKRVRMGQTYCEEHATLAYVKTLPKK